MSLESAPYAEPRPAPGVDDCVFYHTMDLPGVGLVRGPWDLRQAPGDYLGGVDFHGKRALDIGTASGFLCFEMERRGAEVVGYDLSPDTESWDMVAFGGRPDPTLSAERTSGMGRINNSWWLAHQALGSQAKVVYGSVYDMPESIGPVDVAVFGAILLHLRDPFRAMERALALTGETVVITEPAGRAARAFGYLPRAAALRLASSSRLPANLGFLPDPRVGIPYETWWRLTPWAVARMVQVLGFDVTRVAFHDQVYLDKPCRMYTVVGHRKGSLRAPRA
jgi:SAM-dependent methyltransferase